MTNRWLLNAISQAVKFKILIADGGNVPLEISYEIKNKLQIEHVKTPYDKDHLTYMKKLSFRDIMRIVYRMLSLPIIAIIVIIPFLLILLL